MGASRVGSWGHDKAADRGGARAVVHREWDWKQWEYHLERFGGGGGAVGAAWGAVCTVPKGEIKDAGDNRDSWEPHS